MPHPGPGGNRAAWPLRSSRHAPGKAFDPAALDEPTRKAMEAGLAAGLARIRARAAYAMKAICLNSPEEAYYPAANVDAKGDPLDGSKHRYAIRFQSGHLPPARYFWSLTMYRKSDGLLVETPIKRYSIGDRTTGLKHGNDGSLTVHLQHDSPGADKESNWLPAPNEPLLRPRAHLWVARATFPP